MKPLLIMNPGSGSGRGKRRWAIWEEGLARAGIEFKSIETKRLGDAFEAAATAEDCDIAVAVGGDGTINEVLDGVMQSGRPELRMGVLYSGTSPDFCRFHGIPISPEEAMAEFLGGESRRVDVARIRYRDERDRERMSHFGCSCSVGLGAAVASFSNRARRFTGDRLGTLVAVLRAFGVCESLDLELEIDGETRLLPKTNNLSVVKNPHIASGLKLNLGLEPDDGRMSVVGVHGKGRFGLLRGLPGFYSGQVVARPDVFVRNCSTICIRSSSKQQIEFDGDPRGFLPAYVEIMPQALNLVGASNE